MPEEKVLCTVCGVASSIFQVIKETGKTVRLSKTMYRVMGHGSQAVYVHEGECLFSLARNWVKHAEEANK